MKQLTSLLIICLATGSYASAQTGDPSIKKGNDKYKKGDYAAAEAYYKKALIKEPGNLTAKYNLGNALEKQKKEEQAAAMFNDVVSSGKGVDSAMKARAYYNKGLALAKDSKLPLAIDAFKQALRLTPDDEHARENLQKAMNELRQQQQQNQPQNQNQNQNQQQQEKPEPQKEEKKQDNKLNQKQAEQMLGQLRDNEKQLQKKIQKGNTPPAQNKKDW